MTFFNRKEEVMEVQLTQYGKYLLSKGKFKPVSYAFFDDDIIYDPAYGGQPKELAQETLNRISSVPRIRTVYNIDGVETRVLKLNEHNHRSALDSHGRDRKDYFKTSLKNTNIPLDDVYGIDHIDKKSMNVEDRSILKYMIGTSELGNQDYPAWKIRSLSAAKINESIVVQNEDTGLNEYQTVPLKASGSHDRPEVKKYQLDMNPRMIILNHSSEIDSAELNVFRTSTGFEDSIEGLPDNRSITFLQKPDMIFDIQELNVFSGDDSFEIEVFEITDIKEKNKDHLKKLYFTESLDEVEEDKVPPEMKVETYFDINFDSDVLIPRDILSEQKLKRAILDNAMGEYFNSRVGSNVTLYKEGVDITGVQNEISRRKFDKNDLTPEAKNPRDQIGSSLYDFDRDPDDEACD